MSFSSWEERHSRWEQWFLEPDDDRVKKKNLDDDDDDAEADDELQQDLSNE